MKFEGIILKPTGGWSEETLRSITDSIIGRDVREDAPIDAMQVGEVTDAEYVDGEGVKCTIKVYQKDIAEMVEQGLAKFAPALTVDKGAKGNPTFEDVFMTSRPADDVGEFNRKI